jgi:hypothetical protein
LTVKLLKCYSTWTYLTKAIGLAEYVTRFESLFAVSAETRGVCRGWKSIIMTLDFIISNKPNHQFLTKATSNTHFCFDISYCRITREFGVRFHEAFYTSAVRLVKLKDANFVLINSMAVEMDGCFLCEEAVQQLKEVRFNSLLSRSEG